MKGWYSLVQYCPDASRGEAANVGVVLLCPEALFLAGKIANGNDRIRRFFQARDEALERIDEAKHSFALRLDAERGRIRKPEDLIQFAETRANEFVLTSPRVTRVDEPEECLRQLYDELVGGRAIGEHVERKPRGASALRKLHEVFSHPSIRELVDYNVPVRIPVLNQTLRAKYAFTNGVLNIVCPQTIHNDEDLTLSSAVKLATKGFLLQKHGADHRAAKMIVVLPSVAEVRRDIAERVDQLFADHDLRRVQEYRLEDLAREVEETAHR